jgi:hypothetical protein
LSAASTWHQLTESQIVAAARGAGFSVITNAEAEALMRIARAIERAVWDDYATYYANPKAPTPEHAELMMNAAEWAERFRPKKPGSPLGPGAVDELA